VANDLSVPRESRVIDLTCARFDARPLDRESHTVKAQLGHEIEDRLVLAPEVIGATGSDLTLERDHRRVAGGRFSRTVEAPLDGVALEGHVQSAAITHAASFARLPLMPLRYRFERRRINERQR